MKRIAILLVLSTLSSLNADDMTPARHALAQETRELLRGSRDDAPTIMALVREVKASVGMEGQETTGALSNSMSRHASVDQRNAFSRPELRISRGLLESNLNEIKGVIAHELGHIKHHHILKRRLFLASFGVALPATLAYKAYTYIKKHWSKKKWRNFWLLCKVAGLGGIYAVLTKLAYHALQRHQEYSADSVAAEHHAQGMRNFLTSGQEESRAHLAAGHPSNLRIRNRLDPTAGWFTSHPSHPQRIARLDRHLARQAAT